MHTYYNPNPYAARVGDCAVRACAKALDQDWDKTYIDICLYGLLQGDMPSSNSVWGRYLREHGFKRQILPDKCPDCYTVKDFCKDHNKGTFVLAVSGHVVTVVDGKYYDTWDSGDEVPIYFFER